MKFPIWMPILTIAAIATVRWNDTVAITAKITPPSQPATQMQTVALQVGQPAPIDTIPDVLERSSPSVMMIRSNRELGTAFVVQLPSGAIVALTNAHVVEGATALQGVTAIGQPVTATVKGIDPNTDIAVLLLDVQLAPLPLRTQSLRQGEWVVAMGNPYGYSGSASRGSIAKPSRQVSGVADPMIQVDINLNPGNSGGPLLDTQGQVVGVNRAIDKQAKGLAYTVPIATAISAAEKIMAAGGSR